MIAGDDGESAVFKTEEFFNSIKDGCFPPRWAKRLNFGLGQPTFTFTYQIPFYLTSGLMFLGTDAVEAFKLVLLLSFPIAGYLAYLWLKEPFGFWPGIAGGVIYAYLPYHLTNVYARGAIGEVVAASLLPLSFLAIDRNRKSLIALGVSLVLLSHIFYGLIFTGIWLIYGKFKKNVWMGIVWGYICAAFYLVPMLWYKNLTFLSEIEKYLLEKPSVLPVAQLPEKVGLIVVLLSIGSLIYLIWPKRRDNYFYPGVLFGLVGLMGIYLVTENSLWVWKLFPLLRSVQFPWRMMMLVNPATTYLATYFIYRSTYKSNKKWLYGSLVIWLVIWLARNSWSVERYYPLIDVTKTTIGYPGTLTLLQEETPKWYDIREAANPYNFATVVTGDADIKNMVWKTNYHKYSLNARRESIAKDKTMWWPGWKVYLDGKETKLFDPYSPQSLGVLTFSVPVGNHIIESKLTEPPLNLISNVISGISIIALVILLCRHEQVV